MSKTTFRFLNLSSRAVKLRVGAYSMWAFMSSNADIVFLHTSLIPGTCHEQLLLFQLRYCTSRPEYT